MRRMNEYQVSFLRLSHINALRSFNVITKDSHSFNPKQVLLPLSLTTLRFAK